MFSWYFFSFTFFCFLRVHWKTLVNYFIWFWNIKTCGHMTNEIVISVCIVASFSNFFFGRREWLFWNCLPGSGKKVDFQYALGNTILGEFKIYLFICREESNFKPEFVFTFFMQIYNLSCFQLSSFFRSFSFHFWNNTRCTHKVRI